MKKVSLTTVGMVIAFAFVLVLAGCNQYDESEIVGKWKFSKGPYKMVIKYKSDNTYTSYLKAGAIDGKTKGEWSLQGSSITTEVTESTLPGNNAGKTGSMKIKELSDKKIVLNTDDGTNTLHRVN